MSMDVFSLSREQMRAILAKAMSRGGEFADVYCEHSRFNSLIMEEGILKTAIATVEKGVGVRVVKGEKTGYAYTEVLNQENFMKIAATAAAIADDQGSEKNFEIEPTQHPNYYPVQDLSGNIELDRKIALIGMADKYARSLNEKVIKVAVSYADHTKHILMADTEGRLVEDIQPMLRFTVSVIAQNGDDRQQARYGGGGRVGFGFLTEDRIKEWAKTAVDEALVLLEAEQAPAGKMPVILSPGDSGILLHEAIGHPLEADFNRKGTSAYSGRVGEMVAGAQCTIIDDGTVEHDRGSINVDDELNASQKTVLIEDGKLAGYMYDEMSARFFKQPSSGNGRRESFRYQPLPRMRTTYMLPGNYDHEEIIRTTDHGIYCKTFKGGQVDISNGNFIFVPSEAYLIENGRITKPVKNFSLIGNGPDVLSKVTMIGNDFKFSPGMWTCGKGQSVPVGVGLPTVKISEITVGGRQG